MLRQARGVSFPLVFAARPCAQEGLEAQATEEHASLRDAESELQTLDAALQEMNTLDEDLQGLAREKERLEREARGQQVEVVALGVDGEPSSRGEQRTMSVEERKARESEAHELEVALHVKRNERERKRRELEGRFKSVFSDVESRREALRRVEDGVQDMEATRQRKVRGRSGASAFLLAPPLTGGAARGAGSLRSGSSSAFNATSWSCWRSKRRSWTR